MLGPRDETSFFLIDNTLGHMNMWQDLKKLIAKIGKFGVKGQKCRKILSKPYFIKFVVTVRFLKIQS